jgi:hypothetical protein
VNYPRALLFIAALCAAVQCSSPASPSRDAIFQVRACRGSLHAPNGEVFRILLRDPALIDQARGLVGVGNQRIVRGNVTQGDGGFNAPWSWHLDPDSVRFPQVTPEICDTCPSFAPGAGDFCPWSSEVIGEEK